MLDLAVKVWLVKKIKLKFTLQDLVQVMTLWQTCAQVAIIFILKLILE